MVGVAGVVGVVTTRPILWSLALGILARFGCMLLNSCYLNFTPRLHKENNDLKFKFSLGPAPIPPTCVAGTSNVY